MSFIFLHGLFYYTQIMKREELVKLILKKSKSKDTLMILAISETDVVKQIYYKLYNIE